MKNKKIHPCIFYTIIIFYLEILLKIVMTKQVFNLGLIYLLIFTLPIILLMIVLSKSFHPIVNRIISILLVLIITIFFGVQFVYFTLFSVPFSFSSIGMADQALDFVTIIKDTLLKYWYYILAIIGPFIIFCILQKKIDYSKYSLKKSFIFLGITIVTYLATFTILIPNQQNSKKLYYNIDNPIAIIDRFGMLTYTKVDIKRQLFGYEAEIL